MKKVIFVVLSLVLNFYSFAESNCSSILLIHQAVYSKVISDIGIPCRIEGKSESEENERFSKSDAGTLIEFVPNEYRGQFKEAYVDLYKNKEDLVFLSYKVLIARDVLPNISITLSSIGFSKQKKCALLYFEMINSNNQGNGGFVFLASLEKIWDIISINYIWKT